MMDDEKKSHFEKGGRCKTYQIMGKNLVIPSLKWRKDKSGIYKYMRTQTTKYICQSLSTTPWRPIISAEAINSQSIIF